MRQILQSYRHGELWLAEVPAPQCQPNGALVRTAVSLVSAGTERMIIELAQKSLLGKARARPDLVRKVLAKIRTEGLAQTLSKIRATLDTPIPLGYSCAGTVVEAGGNSAHLRPGDRVACGGAGFATHAEFNYVPRNLIVKVPKQVSFDDASFATLGAIAMQGVRQADVRIGERVAVIGLGLLGLLTLQILQAAGCRVLGGDPIASRCELARSLGADAATSGPLAPEALAFTDGEGADAVIITAATPSNEPIEIAAEICRAKGRVVVVGMVGMEVPRDPFYRKELDLRLSMSYGPGRYDPSYEQHGRDYPLAYVRWTEQRNMSSFLELVAAGRVTPSRLVSHRFEIASALLGYELLRRGESLGILIEYPSEAPMSPTIELRQRVKRPDRIGIGLIGAGSFAKGVILPALRRIEGIELVGLCTNRSASAGETARQHGFAYATTDPAALLADAAINTVFILTRHDSHALLACQALRAGKHVFVEKPLCMRPQDLDDYEQALRDSPGCCLTAGFNRRYSPHTLAIREAMSPRRGPTLITYRINAGSLPADSWLIDPGCGGGRIVGEVCHFVDWCECVIGSAPVSVHATSAGAPDSVVATIRYEDASVATIQYLTWGPSNLAKERIEIFADGKAAVLEDFVRTTFHGCRARPIKTRQDKGHSAELVEFFRTIRNGSEPPISLDSLWRTTRTTFSILESLQAGRGIAPGSTSALE